MVPIHVSLSGHREGLVRTIPRSKPRHGWIARVHGDRPTRDRSPSARQFGTDGPDRTTRSNPSALER
ncbi:hypothetical protein EA462_10800 [Natrarchaeobius halalkaliphilus]|uniref:Uncharacterized protein n=1 Tax=Natrarchaeobius halalkaliphilus TaxID=1679091 RepID=A0A3N6LJX4_9EURY|nr:hypothetical protein EA462_10800 [Natrarchaeobius halalkaliphilus]